MTSNDPHTQDVSVFASLYGRRTRIALFLLFLSAAALVAGGLFIQYQLGITRERFQAYLASRAGISLTFDRILNRGLRSLEIVNLSAELTPAEGVSLRIFLPQVFLYFDPFAIFKGKVELSSVELIGGTVRLNASEGNAFPTFKATASTGAEQTWKSIALRLHAHDLNFSAKVGDRTILALDTLSIDVTQLPDFEVLLARIQGNLALGQSCPFEAGLRFRTLTDFDLRIHSDALGAREVTASFPELAAYWTDGRVHPSLRLSGYANGSLICGLELEAEQVRLAQQPPWLAPITGNLNVLAEYNAQASELRITNAAVQSQQLQGRVEGTVRFVDHEPVLDLRAEARDIPIESALQSVREQIESYGSIHVDALEPASVAVALRGPFRQPELQLEAYLAGASLVFAPKETTMPQAALTIASVRISWDNTTKEPKGSLLINDGYIESKVLGLRADKIRTTLSLEPDRLVLDPLTLQLNDDIIVGKAAVDIPTRETTFDVNGTLSRLETFPPLKKLDDFAMSGAVNVRCSGKFAGNRLNLDATVEATQAQIEYEWWLRKPIGVGTTVHSLKLELVPNRTLKISGEANLDNCLLQGTFEWAWYKGDLRLMRIRAKGDPVDATTAGKVLRIPYAVSGGIVRNGFLEWERTSQEPDGHVMTIGGDFTEVNMLPRGVAQAVHAKEGKVVVVLDDSDKKNLAGKVTIEAEEGNIPPLGVDWLLPFEPDDPVLKEKYKDEPRRWNITAKTHRFSMPPWQGEDFSTDVYTDDAVVRLDSFKANVEGGLISGRYEQEKSSNVGRLSAQWENVPVKYFLDHLEYPEVVTGRVTGHIDYTVDHDDPNTLRASGAFELNDGQIQAEYMQMFFGAQSAGGLTALPPILSFATIRSSLQIEADHVKTPDLTIIGNGINIQGNGGFIRDGDMDYVFNVKIDPTMAEQVPALRTYFNLRGMRLTQNTIDLSFKVSGPSFKPRSAIRKLPPVDVTLVSGAAELATEAVRIVDLPRQILLDLFRVGGGVLGATTR